MAKWTLREYISALRERIDEVGSTDYFTDKELTGYINAAINDMAKELRVEDYKSIKLVEVNTFDYKEVFITETEKVKPIQDRNHDFFMLKGIFIDRQPLPIGTIEDKMRGKEVAIIWGGKIQFTTPKTGDMEVFYFRRPRPLVNTTDTTDVPELYQHIPLIYAVAQCRRKDENEADYNSTIQDYNLAKLEMEQEVLNIESDNIGTINITNYGWDE